MQRALIAIGVDAPVSDFPRLRAAADGAKQIAAWGAQQGFDVTLLTDSEGKTVSVLNVLAAVRNAVDARIYSQLVVYFSGHGLLLAADTEVWLLSGALTNPNDAINVNGSVTAARTSGIPHVVFVSDACRSMPKQFRLGMVAPGLIFPPRQPQPQAQRPEIDIFYATLPGDPALEVPPNQAKRSFRGLLTSCMLEALKGMPPTLVEQVQDGTASRRVVASRPLKGHLIQAVPTAAAAASISLLQMPDIRVESALPKYLSDLSGHELAKPKPPADDCVSSDEQPLTPTTLTTNTLSYSLTQTLRRSVNPSFDASGELAAFGNDEIRREVNQIVESWQQVAVIAPTGFTVSGIGVVDVTLHPIHQQLCVLTIANGATQIQIMDSPAADHSHMPRAKMQRQGLALVRFTNGTGIVLSVLQGYIGSVVVDSGVVRTVNYAPHGGGLNGWSRYIRRIEERRALVAVAARHGSFRLDRENADHIADYLRRDKSFDPTLGLYAAYAYAQSGNYPEVLSVFRYMRRDPAPVLFDVAMLAAQRARGLVGSLDFAPWLPVLTQGWMLLGDFEEAMPSILREAAKHLLPGLWTTFAKEGLDVLDDYFAGNET